MSKVIDTFNPSTILPVQVDHEGFELLANTFTAVGDNIFIEIDDAENLIEQDDLRREQFPEFAIEAYELALEECCSYIHFYK
jgi:hypothetical protein